MENASPDCATPDQIRPCIAQRLLKPMAFLLRTGDPHATMDRLFRSQHVKDLQLIVAFALSGVLAILIVSSVVLFYAIRDKADWTTPTHDFLTFIAPVLVVFGAVLTWAYQVGSARLGVVDLFACEISTLCRVALVVETVGRFVDRFKQRPPTETAGAPESPTPAAQQFNSQEDYFPVFENNSKDLQTLEARVVINITAFYTYMKAFRDSLRTLGEASTAGPWHEAARNVIYMLYLGLESARLAITDLVEFEPEKAERTIVVLISELEAYGFLRSQFTDEKNVFHQRLMLRLPEYRQLVPKLCGCVEVSRAEEAPKHRDWEPASVLLDDLNDRFKEAVVGQSVIAASG
jgi:hypothetical protein